MSVYFVENISEMSHSIDDKDAFLCEVCGRGFATREELRDHLFEHESNPNVVEDILKRAV